METKSVKAQIAARCRVRGITRPDNGQTPTGAIVWEGPSAWDGEPIAVVLSWYGCTASGARANTKTGRMIQSYIVRKNGSPVADLKTGADASICGDCPHRPERVAEAVASGRPHPGRCYVNVGQGPRAVADGMARGIYPTITLTDAVELVRGFLLRLGTYGDPGMAPATLWGRLVNAASDHTGYTHRAADTGADLIGLLMASADSRAEARDLRADGWQTFRVSTDPSETRDRSEARCPASAEAGRRVTCETCPIRCNGVAAGAIAGRVIFDHGPGGIGRSLDRAA